MGTAFRAPTLSGPALTRASSALIVLFVTWAMLPPANVYSASADTAAQCAQAGNDDTIIPYDPSLQAGLARAYARLFPGAPIPPLEAQLKDGANIRCMNGRLLACFTGANLPCGKMNAGRDNPGADEYCHADANADVVPAFATGHEAIYSYRCTDGRPEIVGTTFSLDARGFAARLWAPLD
jgi:hypothetical protein